MVNEEILGGLKSALEKGQPLKRAMMSFYNSGYKKEEIEEAARVLISRKNVQTEYPPQEPQATNKKYSSQPIFKKKKTSGWDQKKIIKKVSEYDQKKKLEKLSEYEPKKSKRKFLIIAMIIALVLLLGVLILIIVFKDEVISIFSSLF